jgi:primosomal protein N' (replication factor Y)
MPENQSVYSFALNLPLYQLFDYQLDGAVKAQPGQRFLVPFGSSDKVGIVVQRLDDPAQVRELKAVTRALDEHSLLSPHMIELARWMSEYYLQPLGEVLFQCLPGYCRSNRHLTSTRLQYWLAAPCAAHDADLRNRLKIRAPRQYALLQAIEMAPHGLNAAELRDLDAHWAPPVKALQKKGLVIQTDRDSLENGDGVVRAGPPLTPQQLRVVDDMGADFERFAVHLLQGVTGSGKTEVYLQLMQRALDAGSQVIYLVPEIGLTPQLLERLRSRLGPVIVSSHSSHSDYRRYQAWDQFRRGAAQVIVGTRSALFSEAPDIGLIIVDEEHDASFRQQDGVRYHARDVAVKRAQMLDIPIILGSATPALESLFNLGKAHYHLHSLSERPNRSQPPAIELIDIANSPLQAGCSPPLIDAIGQHLEAGEQVLLFLNRRGYAPVVMCYECGWQASCFQCDARLTLHRSLQRLVCHHCGHVQAAPEICPKCAAPGVRHLGVGTQQLEAFVQQRFSDFPVVRIDRDSVSSAADFERMLQPVIHAQPCILLGTQMLAKGHDYPHISLVGIIDADQALYSGFYRAAERLVQTVLQVSGRAGRAERPGRALLQTAFASHPLMQGLCRNSYSELAQGLLAEREMLGFPPYARAVSFVVDAVELDDALARLQKIRDLIDGLQMPKTLRVVGPIPALMTRRVGRYRAQLSLISRDMRQIRGLLRQLMPGLQRQRNDRRSRLVIEVDPQDL